MRLTFLFLKKPKKLEKFKNKTKMRKDKLKSDYRLLIKKR
jgi:hypothetical protein